MVLAMTAHDGRAAFGDTAFDTCSFTNRCRMGLSTVFDFCKVGGSEKIQFVSDSFPI